MTAQANAYDAGIMKLSGKDFADQFFAEENQIVHESGAVVLALKKSDEINTIVEEILLTDFKKKNPSLVVQDRAGYWWLKADGEIVIDCDEATELLGREYRVYDFLVDVSTTIGRAYTLGNVFTITSELMGLDRKLEDVR
jgi:methane monooxygenase regulatory protein B